jgi:hypothetical protein
MVILWSQTNALVAPFPGRAFKMARVLVLGSSLKMAMTGLSIHVQGRVASVGQVLYGTYAIPASADQPIDIVLNPQGAEARSLKRWGFSFSFPSSYITKTLSLNNLCDMVSHRPSPLKKPKNRQSCKVRNFGSNRTGRGEG